MNETAKEPTKPVPSEDDPPRLGAGARALIVIAIVLVAGLIFLLISSGDDSGTSDTVMSPYAGAERVEVSEVAGLSEDAGHGVYWAGEKSGDPVGVSTDDAGNVHLRYLPEGVEPDDPGAGWLDVGSYPFPGAYAATAALAKDKGNVQVKVPGAVAFYPESRPTSVILAFRKDPDVQVEVFHPEPKKALAFVESGAIVPVP